MPQFLKQRQSFLDSIQLQIELGEIRASMVGNSIAQFLEQSQGIVRAAHLAIEEGQHHSLLRVKLRVALGCCDPFPSSRSIA